MGRNNRDRWTFYNHPSKRVIDSDEARYWKGALRKILKIGLEFEFNLPDKNGTCKGDNNACPCGYMQKDECWKECIRLEECRKERGSDFECYGLACTNFLSTCVVCNKFSVDCASCEHRYDPARNPEAIRDRMGKTLQPSKSYGTITKHGVHSIVTDGSLLGKKGAEVITTGRRVDYWEFFKMTKNIIDLAIDNHAYVNERCSIHGHLLASYYGKLPNGEDSGPGIPPAISEMEKDMPEIILANFHQLCRRYQNAITWMTIGLDDPKRMTRWEKFRVSILPISAVMNNMAQVQKEVSSHSSSETSSSAKYGWVNYNYCQFAANGDVKRFHVEMRTMDGLLAPSAVAAVSCLYYALMIKAVEISRYGVVEVGDKQWMTEAEKIKATLLNNRKSYSEGDRFGDTTQLHKHYDTLIGESFDLISQVKHILMKIGPAYEVLEKLAERPCALRRCDGETWEKIERDLEVHMTPEDMFVRKLSEIIDLRMIDQCTDEQEWIREACGFMKKDPQMGIDPDDVTLEDRVVEFVNRKKNDGEMVFLDRVGAMALI